MALSRVPAYYQVPIFRRLAEKLGDDFLALFANAGQAKGLYEPTYGQVVRHDTGLLEGYPNTVLGVPDEGLRTDLLRELRAKLSDTICSFKPTAMLLNTLQTDFVRSAMRFGKATGSRFVLRSTPTDLGRRNAVKAFLRRLVSRRSYRKIQAFCAVGSQARAHFLRAGVSEERIFSSPYCVDEWVLEPLAARREELRREGRAALGLAQESMVFSFIGRLVPVKDLAMLVRAAARLRHVPRVHWVIAGSGPLMNTLSNQVHDLHVDNLILAGALSRHEVARLLSASDAFVLPSLSETWGVVVNEAMMFGLPCVLSDQVSAAYDLLEDGKTGFMFPASDEDAFVRAVEGTLKLIDNDNGLADRVRERVEGFSAEEATAGVLRALEFAHAAGRR